MKKGFFGFFGSSNHYVMQSNGIILQLLLWCLKPFSVHAAWKSLHGTNGKTKYFQLWTECTVCDPYAMLGVFYVLALCCCQVVLVGGSSRFVNFKDRLQTALAEPSLELS